MVERYYDKYSGGRGLDILESYPHRILWHLNRAERLNASLAQKWTTFSRACFSPPDTAS